MTVVHIAEAGGYGIQEFIRCIIHFDANINHVIVYGRDVEESTLPEEFHRPNVRLIAWKNVQREINIKRDYLAYRELSKILSGIKSENYVVHLHSSKAGAIGRIWGLFHRRVKILYTPHGISFARKDISRLAKLVYQGIELILSRLSGKMICVSRSERELCCVIDKRAIYINNGIVIDDSVKNELKVQKDKFTIVTTGRLFKQKNPALFNQIAKRFELNENIRFVWIGDGDLRGTITSPNIRVTGRLNKNEVYHELLNADLYISTALWEGLPYAVLEAMNCHLPLLLYQSVGNVDLVKEGVNGSLFTDIEQACRFIDKIYDNSNMQASMGEESYNYLKDDFDAEKMAAKYYAEYWSE